MRYLTLLVLAACADGTLNDDSDTRDDTGADVDSESDSDTSADSDVDTDTPAADWSAVDDALDDALTDIPDDVPGFGLMVWDDEGTLVYTSIRGTFDVNERIPVASGSKLISALTLLRLVETDVLALDDTTGEVLGWSGAAGQVSLDQLGAFVSGFSPDMGCQNNPLITLQACAQNISESPAVAAPGALLEYGGSHLHVAGAMAEVETGQSWNDLFHDVMAEPLGLTNTDLRYVTLPKQAIGERNARVAGGLLATPVEYGRILSLVLAEGQLNNQPFIDPVLVDRLFRNEHASAAVGTLPSGLDTRDWRYSFGAWLECDGPVTQCDIISSAGAYGLTPWVDRATGYTGLVAMEGDAGSAVFGLRVEQAVQPLIEDVFAQID
jgi:CubicO group peptidase (beta-lactamase class C family)